MNAQRKAITPVRLQNVKHLHWPRASNRLPASACRDGRQYRAEQLDVPDDRPGRFTVVAKIVRITAAHGNANQRISLHNSVID
jgi:hypothetical protein